MATRSTEISSHANSKVQLRISAAMLALSAPQPARTFGLAASCFGLADRSLSTSICSTVDIFISPPAGQISRLASHRAIVKAISSGSTLDRHAPEGGSQGGVIGQTQCESLPW